MARSSVYNVGEQKGIYCEGKNVRPEQMEWLSPEGTVVGHRSSKNNRVYIERREPNLLVLIIHSLKLKDYGNWTCKMKEGDVSETIEVIVGEKATVDDDEVKHEDEGKNLKLFCRTKGNPQPVVQWYKEGSVIEEDPTKYIIRNKSDVYTLEIKKLNHADAGQYQCKVTQKLLTHYVNKKIELSVLHRPIHFDPETGDIIIVPGSQKFRVVEVFAVLNETKNVTCGALANPPPKFQWQRRKNGFDQPIRDEDMILTSDDFMSSTLTLRMQDESDEGQYKCTATNERGTAVTMFHVTLGEKPNPPENISFVASNHTYMTFNVTCSSCLFQQEENASPDPKNLPVIGYSFQLVQHEEGYIPAWERSEEFEISIEDPDDVTFDVGPLSNATVFHVRVRSINLAGYSDWLDWPKNLPLPQTAHAVRLACTILLMVTSVIAVMLN